MPTLQEVQVDWNYNRAWYHGTQRPLSELRPGSSITPYLAIAQAFSHRPSLVSTGRAVRHNGASPGYIYLIDESIGPDDVYPDAHQANAEQWEWRNQRPLRLRLLEFRPEAPQEEQLTEEEMADLHRRRKAGDRTSFYAPDATKGWALIG